MAYFMDMKPGPAPDYSALLKDIRPTRKPILDSKQISDAARIAGETAKIIALELLGTGCVILQGLLFTSLQLFTSLAFLFGLLHILARYFRGVFKIAEWAFGGLLTMLSALVWCIGVTCKFSGVMLNVLWLHVLGRTMDVMYGDRKLRFGFKGYANVQEWEPPQDGQNLREASRDVRSDWFAEHPVPPEPVPTPTSRRQWKFSYSNKKSVVEPLTPPITPTSPATSKNAARHAMLTELLGFVPQLLLDDIADAATDTVNNAIEGLEDYLRKWLASREQQPPNDDLEAEIENGLLEFHTLLCGHRDMSIDMLETWSMRNVFHVPPELKIVMPHQRGLDLTTPPGRDVKAQVELDVLRRKIENARKFREQLKRADEITQQRLERSEARLEQLKFLRNLDPTQVESLPNQIRSLFTSLRSLSTAVPPLPSAPAEGSRPHTESRPEFLDWAIKRLVDPNTGTATHSRDLGGAVSSTRGDEEGEDERRLVGSTSSDVVEQTVEILSSQEREPSSSQTRGRADLSTIQEADDQEQDITQPFSFAGPSSQPSSSQAQPSSSQTAPQNLSQSSSQPQNLSQTSTLFSDASSSTITTIKRRRSSMIGPGMGGGGKRRRSSLGLAERARAGNPSTNGATNGSEIAGKGGATGSGSE